jgi:hypothetical protein
MSQYDIVASHSWNIHCVPLSPVYLSRFSLILTTKSLSSQVWAARGIELVEHMQVSLDQPERLFFHFFRKVTRAEPVCWQMIVMVAALKQCLQHWKNYKWTNGCAWILMKEKYFSSRYREAMGSHYVTRQNVNSFGQQTSSFLSCILTRRLL